MLRLFAVLLIASSAIASEVPLTVPQYTASVTLQSRVRVASNGDGYLAVWSDPRGDTRGESREIWASRYTAEGKLLEPANILVAASATLLDVVWTGQHYLVACSNLDTRVVPITAGGLVGNQKILRPDSHAGPISMASNGTTVLLVSYAWAVLMTSGGDLITTFQHPAAASETPLAVDADGLYVLAHPLKTGLRITRVDDRGEIVSTADLTTEWTAWPATLAGDGRRLLLVYGDQPTVGSQLPGLRGVPLENGVPSAALTTLVEPSAGVFQDLRMVWTGRDYTLTYRRGVAYSFLRVSRHGRPFGTPQPLPVQARDRADVASAGNGSASIVWPAETGGVLAAELTQGAGAPLGDVVTISRMATRQTDVRSAQDGAAVFLAWKETISPSRVQLRLALRGGREVLVVEDGVSTELQEITLDGDTIWLWWRTATGDQVVQRYTRTLDPIDAEPFVVTRAKFPPASLSSFAVANGVAVAAGGVPSNVAVHLRLDATGKLTSTIVQLTTSFSPRTAVAWDGEAFAVALVSTVTRTSPISTISVRRIDREGRLLDAAPLDIHATLGAIPTLRAATTANGALFAWNDSGPARTVVALMKRNGAAATPRVVEKVTELDQIVSTGDRIAVIWKSPPSREITTVRAELLDTNLTPIEETSIDLPAPGNQRVPTAVFLLDGELAIAYSRPAREPLYGGVHRLFVRNLTEAVE